ncbi:MAG: sulfide/dihydroorotate dehydrogenase-like FAD/NAD-binding protein, partial [Lachnospiraceae bacterium]
KKAQAGQFVILRAEEDGERIPLTVAGYDREQGTVDVIFQIAGAATMKLDRLEEGDRLPDFAGPLGNATKIDAQKKVCVVGGGVGCAIALPVAKAFREAGAEVVSVIGFRNKELVILEDEFKAVSSRLYVMTDDGSYARQGNVCAPLEEMLAAGETFDEAITIGPLAMMKFVAQTTKKYGVKTIASMNPIMIDGTGMCGGCRLTVGGKMKFACVDGPEFDAHEIDFDEAMTRSGAFREFEAREREKTCNLFKKL